MRVLLEMGLFQALPTDGTSMTARALAEKLNCDEDLLRMLAHGLKLSSICPTIRYTESANYL